MADPRHAVHGDSRARRRNLVECEVDARIHRTSRPARGPVPRTRHNDHRSEERIWSEPANRNPDAGKQWFRKRRSKSCRLTSVRTLYLLNSPTIVPRSSLALLTTSRRSLNESSLNSAMSSSNPEFLHRTKLGRSSQKLGLLGYSLKFMPTSFNL